MPIKTSVWLLLYSGNEVLLLKRSKKANNPNIWNLLGGGVEKNEDPKKAVIREAFEEGGVKIKNPKFLCSFPVSKDKFCHYYAKEISKNTIVTINEESSEYKWLKIKNVNTLQLHAPTKALFEILNIKWLKFVASTNNTVEILKNKKVEQYTVKNNNEIVATINHNKNNKIIDIQILKTLDDKHVLQLISSSQKICNKIKLHHNDLHTTGKTYLVNLYSSLGFDLKTSNENNMLMEWKK